MNSSEQPYPYRMACVSEDENGLVEHHYLVLGKIAEGGQAEVFKAQDLDSPKAEKPFVAIKRLKMEYAPTGEVDGIPNEVARFIREYSAVAEIKHPNVMRVLDIGTDSATNRPMYVMPYVRNGITVDHLKDDRMSALERGEGKNKATGLIEEAFFDLDEQIPTIFNQMLDADEAVHKEGLIHRDLKPSNFLAFKRGGKLCLLLADLGIMRSFSPEARKRHGATLTAAGDMVGTPNYMAPEQFRPKEKVDERTDIWALGVILYELVTGHRPFDDEKDSSFLDMQWRILEDNPPPFSTFITGACPEYERFVRRLLSKKKEDRPPTIAAVRKEFQDMLAARAKRKLRRPQVTTNRRSLTDGLDTVPVDVGEVIKAVQALPPAPSPALKSTPSPTVPQAISADVSKRQPARTISRPQQPVRSSRVGLKIFAGLAAFGAIGGAIWYMTSSQAPQTDAKAGASVSETARVASADRTGSETASASAPKIRKNTCPANGSPEDANWQKARKGNCQATLLYGNLTVAKHPDCVEAHVLLAKCKIKQGADACPNLRAVTEVTDAPPLTADLQKILDAKCASKP